MGKTLNVPCDIQHLTGSSRGGRHTRNDGQNQGVEQDRSISHYPRYRSFIRLGSLKLFNFGHVDISNMCVRAPSMPDSNSKVLDVGCI